MSTFWIESAAEKQDGKVILWEVAPGHPNGECFIAGDGIPVEVNETEAIKRLLAEGVIKKVTSWRKDAYAPPKQDEVLATDEQEEVAPEPAPKPIPNGGINRGGRPRRGS